MCDPSNPIYHDADKVREHLKSIRWPDGPVVCPHCGVLNNATELRDNTHRPAGLYRCKECRKQFSLTVGTEFDRPRFRSTSSFWRLT